MITDKQMEDLYDSAMAGRGLWVGLFTETKPTPALNPWWPEDAHITLAHLGKSSENAYLIGDLVGLILNLGMKEFMAEVTGVGMFWRKIPTLVALVNSGPLVSVRSSLLAAMGKKVPFSDKYGFIPHITLKPNGGIFQLLVEPDPYQEGVSVSNCKSFQVRFPAISVVCGDVVVPVI